VLRRMFVRALEGQTDVLDYAFRRTSAVGISVNDASSDSMSSASEDENLADAASTVDSMVICGDD